jgi:hypothetical protein
MKVAKKQFVIWDYKYFLVDLLKTYTQIVRLCIIIHIFVLNQIKNCKQLTV